MSRTQSFLCATNLAWAKPPSLVSFLIIREETFQQNHFALMVQPHNDSKLVQGIEQNKNPSSTYAVNAHRSEQHFAKSTREERMMHFLSHVYREKDRQESECRTHSGECDPLEPNFLFHSLK